jgi:ribonucleotide reductase alpha subunit
VGRRNALLLALMPTASTSTMLNSNSESFEPRSSLLYMRRALSSDFPVISKPLVDTLSRLGLWNEAMSQQLLKNNGSVQMIDTIPQDVRIAFKTAFEVSLKTQILHQKARTPWAEQSLPLNIHLRYPSYKKLTSYAFFEFEQRKTVSYYLRMNPPSFTMNPTDRQASIKQSVTQEAEKKEKEEKSNELDKEMLGGK